MKTNEIGVPPRPRFEYGAGSLPALSASTSNSAPLRAGTPKGPAAAPERKVTSPILTGVSPLLAVCDCAGEGASPTAHATTHELNKSQRMPLLHAVDNVIAILRDSKRPARRSASRFPAALSSARASNPPAEIAEARNRSDENQRCCNGRDMRKERDRTARQTDERQPKNWNHRSAAPHHAARRRRQRKRTHQRARHPAAPAEPRRAAKRWIGSRPLRPKRKVRSKNHRHHKEAKQVAEGHCVPPLDSENAVGRKPENSETQEKVELAAKGNIA